MTDNKTDIIVEFINELQCRSFSENIIHTVKECVLDYMGVTHAGMYCLRQIHKGFPDTLITARGRSAVIAGGIKYAAPSEAALINGMSAHYLELDDGSRFAMVHPGAPVISALIAFSQDNEISSYDFIMGIVAGYEVTIRLARAIQPDHKMKGFHATGTCGTIGAAAALCAALNMKTDQTKAAVSAAAACAQGLLEMIEDTSQLKPFNAGKAAQDAITAVMMANAGFTGPRDAIGGKRGFVKATGGSFDASCFSAPGNNDLAIEKIYRKPYASCRHCHSAVEAALKIRDSAGFDVSKISSIQVRTYGLAVNGHEHRDPQGIGSAKMSIPFSVAAALVLGDGGIAAMSEEALENERIMRLASVVSVFEHPDYTVLAPEKRIAKVIITLTSGEVFTKEIIYPKGEPENPMSEKELMDKYQQLMCFGKIPAEYSDQLAEYISDLENSFSRMLSILK